MTTISTSAFYRRANRDIGALRARAEDLQAAIGRGQRLARSSDDPVAAARLRGLQRAGSIATVDRTNARRAMADLQLADAALGTIASHVTRARELAVQAANGTLTPAQRAGIGAEVAQLHGELLRLANSRDGAGHALFGGETAGQAYALDGSGNALYSGTATAGSLDLGDGQSVTRAITGPEFLSFAGTDLLAVVKTLADGLAATAPDPAQAARDALGGLDAGLDAITTAQTVVGTRLNWIELNLDRATRMAELRAEDEAEAAGTDIAATITELQQVMTVLEASQASFVRLSSLSLFDQIR